MQWIQTNMAAILGVWAVVWVIASGVSGIAPATSVAGKVAHVIVALSPLDVVKVWRTLGTAMVPPTVLAIMILTGSQTACTSAERAPIERKLTAALTDENLICLIGTHVPGVPTDVHAGIVAGCQIAGPAAQAALDLLQAADLMHLGDRADAGGP